MGPHLGNVVDVKAVVVSICDGHGLHVPRPRGELLFGDGFEEVHRREIFVLYGHLRGLLRRESPNALVRLEVILHQECLALLIDPLECVGGVAVEEAVSIRSSAV